MKIVGLIVGVVVLLAGLFAVVVKPIMDTQTAKAADTNAKADVATLGYNIATYFVDNDGPPPTITVVNGRYHFDVEIAYARDKNPVVSPGVQFGGVTGTGATDWCVWVTNPKGDLTTFKYSAARGLEAGRC